MRNVFGIGYITQRNDGISELRINGFKQVRDILVLMKPFIRFKKVQTKALIEAGDILIDTPMKNMTEKQIRKIVDLMFIIKGENYSNNNTLNKEELHLRLGLTP